MKKTHLFTPIYSTVLESTATVIWPEWTLFLKVYLQSIPLANYGSLVMHHMFAHAVQQAYYDNSYLSAYR